MPLDRTGLWEFLGEVEGALERPITLVAVGGTALTLLDVKPSTLDVDFTGPGADIRAFLEALRRTPHGFRVQAWEDGLVFTQILPEDYLRRSRFVSRIGRIKLRALHPVDVVVTKIGRLDERDLRDIQDCIRAFGLFREEVAERERELDDLIRDLEAGQSVLLVSSRRYGKTSLMAEVLRRMEEQGHLTALVDLFGCVTPADLAERLVREVVVRHYTRIESLVRFLREGLGSLRPELTFHPEGSVGLSLRQDVKALGEEVVLEEVLDAPQALATRKRKRLVVVLDEFQEVGDLDGEWLLKLIRSKIQHHDSVSYAFTGSKKHTLEQVFASPDGAFYRSARPYSLGRIPPGPFREHILRRFNATGLSLPNGTVERILSFTEGHPYFTQQLCHEVWNLGTARGAVAEEDFEVAIGLILESQREFYAHIWDGLSHHQRRMLRALAKEETDSPYASDFIERNRLVSSSHAKRSLGALLEKQLVERGDDAYRVADLFLREWVAYSLTA